MSECLSSRSVYSSARETCFIHVPCRTPQCVAWWGWGAVGRIAARALREHQRGADPALHLIISKRKTPMSHEGHPACNLPQPPLVHKHLHVPHPAAGSLGMPPGEESMSLCRWLVSTCRKPVRLCKIGRKHTYFSSWDQQRGSTKLSFAGSKDTCVLNRSVISDSLQLHGL